MNWREKYHNHPLKREWLLFSPGVIPSLHAAVRAVSHYKISYNCGFYIVTQRVGKDNIFCMEMYIKAEKAIQKSASPFGYCI